MIKKQKTLYLFNGLLIMAAVVLIWSANKNKTELEKLYRGDRVSGLSLVSLEDTVSIEFGQGYLKSEDTPYFIGLFMYSTLCNACELNYENWNSLYDIHSMNKIKYYYVNMTTDSLGVGKVDGIDYYIPENIEIFDKDFKVPGVPYTVILSKEGIVEYSAIGLIDKEEQYEIKKIISKK